MRSLMEDAQVIRFDDYLMFWIEHIKKFDVKWDRPNTGSWKLKRHTIRAGKRWRPGMMIDFWINMRTKDQFRFAPRVPVVSVQDIEIKHGFAKSHRQVIVNTWIMPNDEVEELAINDGFPDLESFFKWFDSDFEGQIIHWSDLKY